MASYPSSQSAYATASAAAAAAANHHNRAAVAAAGGGTDCLDYEAKFQVLWLSNECHEWIKWISPIPTHPISFPPIATTSHVTVPARLYSKEEKRKKFDLWHIS